MKGIKQEILFLLDDLRLFVPAERGRPSWLQLKGCPVHTGNCVGMASTSLNSPAEESCTSLETCSDKINDNIVSLCSLARHCILKPHIPREMASEITSQKDFR